MNQSNSAHFSLATPTSSVQPTYKHLLQVRGRVGVVVVVGGRGRGLSVVTLRVHFIVILSSHIQSPPPFIIIIIITVFIASLWILICSCSFLPSPLNVGQQKI